MITPAYCQTMARYNHWQNGSLMRAASTISHEDRWRDRGAFFNSIAQTFNHLLWGDRLWLARFSGDRRPHLHIHHDLNEPADWDAFCAQRDAVDAAISEWVNTLDEATISGDVVWNTTDGDVQMSKPFWICATQFFNHQTHHRGQIHAMLTAADAKPEATDLPFMPEK